MDLESKLFMLRKEINNEIIKYPGNRRDSNRSGRFDSIDDGIGEIDGNDSIFSEYQIPHSRLTVKPF